jgi:hypothetical protein
MRLAQFEQIKSELDCKIYEFFEFLSSLIFILFPK